MTIHPNLFGTVPNFEGLSWENYGVFQDTELFRILSRFCPALNVMSLHMLQLVILMA